MTPAVTNHVSGTLSDLDRQIVAAVPPGGNWRDLPIDFPSARVKQIRESAARGEGSRSTYYGRLSWDKPSYTISTYISRPGNGCFIHPAAPRLITVREAARLQTFPDYVQFSGTFRQRSMQVGNAVPPLMAYALGSVIARGTAVDLFSGVGGLGMGLEWAGHDVVASVDYEAAALTAAQSWVRPGHAILRRDLSDEAQFANMISSVRSELLGRPLGLLAGGPPCQGFSTAGPCRVDDPRNELVRAFLRAVEELEPEHVLFENVPSLRSRGRLFLDELMERLHLLGYSVEMRILHAEAYGVPQLRRRLIVQASRSGPPSWPVPSHSLVYPYFKADQPTPLVEDSPPPTVRDAIADLPFSEATSLEQAMVLDKAPSKLAEWLRGEISILELACSDPKAVSRG
ncbi:DNA cytosine methyltransferase [Microbacterium testaceum]|uniref:DNA cytosine methyltransferase n=1 Tax=Microbacterium testaceum TaxID=2033 RepID=UPI001783087A